MATKLDPVAQPRASAEADARQHQRMEVEIFARREGDHWSAMIPKFTIAGRGDTPKDAIENAVQLLGDYLAECFREGLTLQQAVRPAPLANRLRLRMQHRVSQLRRSGGAPVERRQIPPLGGAGLPASC